MKHLLLLFSILLPLMCVADELPDSIKELKELVQQGNTKAQVKLGYFYFTGQGVERDYEKALSLYTKAAEKESLWALNNLCNMYLYGEGVDKDLPKAFHLCREPARAGHSSSMVMIAEIILNIKVGKFSEDRELAESTALNFYTMAAKRGHPQGQFMVGQFYEKGISVDVDKNKAIRWYRAASKNGHTEAGNSLRALQASHNKAN